MEAVCTCLLFVALISPVSHPSLAHSYPVFLSPPICTLSIVLLTSVSQLLGQPCPGLVRWDPVSD